MASPAAEADYSITRFLKIFLHGRKGEGDTKKVADYHLVVAALIAAVTFQSCVNPPGGVWQADSCSNVTGHEVPCSNVAAILEREAGRAVYASYETAFYVFLAFNTLAFSTSMLLLICHTWGFSFLLEVFVAIISMGITYGAAIFAITPNDFKVSRSLLSIASAPIIVRLVILIYKYLTGKWPPVPEGKISKNVGS